MANNNDKLHQQKLPQAEHRRRRREGVLIVVIIFAVALLTFLETRTIYFGADIPVSSTILMFILININLLLLLLLIFLVFRNLVKLFYDRKRRVAGSKLRTRLVLAFITLTLLPAAVLFFFSISFITTSIKFWFNVPVEQTIEHSLLVGRSLYKHIELENSYLLQRAAYQIDKKKLLPPPKRKALNRYVQIVQREFFQDGVEVYDVSANRLTYAISAELEGHSFDRVPTQDLLREIPVTNTRTVSMETPTWELIRTISTIPFGANGEAIEGYVVMTKRISSDLSQKMASIARGFSEYQQIKLLKRPIQISYYISLSIVGSLVAFCAIWFGFYLAKSISIPIKELSDGTRRVAEGDLGFTIAPVADDEIGGLVDSFNKMTSDLRQGREQIELSARMLRQQNIEIEERRQYMEIVLKNVSTGVISSDAEGVVTTVNTSAEKMLMLETEAVLGRDYRTLLDGPLLDMATGIVEKLKARPEENIEQPVRVTIAGRPRSFLVQGNALTNDFGHNIGMVMVFDDLTELEKGQRMAAWREVARRIAHEVKNPLTPITLSAQRLKRRYSDSIREAVFDDCVKMIIDHVDLIRNLVNEFSSFARFPAANPQPCNLQPIIEETVALYREGHERIRFEIDQRTSLPTLNLDRQQIKQAMINLVDNAVSATKGTGHITIATGVVTDGKEVRIKIADSGAGIPDDVKNRLFEPNFSTKKTGMGLGLTIVSTIVSDHNGTIRVRDNSPCGAVFIITIPV